MTKTKYLTCECKKVHHGASRGLAVGDDCECKNKTFGKKIKYRTVIVDDTKEKK